MKYPQKFHPIPEPDPKLGGAKEEMTQIKKKKPGSKTISLKIHFWVWSPLSYALLFFKKVKSRAAKRVNEKLFGS